jgi:hypothetical protein
MRYHSFTKNSEDAKISSEIARNNPNITIDQKSKLAVKCQNSLKAAKDAEKDYITQLNFANIIRDGFIENTKRILTGFQNLELLYIEFLREILKYHNYKRNVLFQNYQKNYEPNLKVIFMLTELIDCIDPNRDIKEFIDKNAISNSAPPSKFEFVPYHSEVLTKPHDQNTFPNGIFPLKKEVLNSLRIFIQTSFLTDIPESEVV